jgi:hypothetical protein
MHPIYHVSYTVASEINSFFGEIFENLQKGYVGGKSGHRQEIASSLTEAR